MKPPSWEAPLRRRTQRESLDAFAAILFAVFLAWAGAAFIDWVMFR